MPRQGGNTIGMPGQAAEVFAGAEVPEADRLVFAGGGQRFPVWADGNGADRFLV